MLMIDEKAIYFQVKGFGAYRDSPVIAPLVTGGLWQEPIQIRRMILQIHALKWCFNSMMFMTRRRSAVQCIGFLVNYSFHAPHV
jgi:hypothetical protein